MDILSDIVILPFECEASLLKGLVIDEQRN